LNKFHFDDINKIFLCFSKPNAYQVFEAMWIMKKYGGQDHISLGCWAADCAERVLPIFEKVFPNDNRPRKAIEICRTWINTGVFRMAVIRNASLNAHSAARNAKENEAASLAARAAGQAVATAHVPQHAYGAAYYALKGVARADPINADSNVKNELDWQSHNIPENLRKEVLKRIIIQKTKKGIKISIQKDSNF